jgi:endonuclease G
VNPDYPSVIGNDITVLILRRAAPARIAPVPIATTQDVAGALKTTLVGFGNDDLMSTKGFGRQREVTVDITHVRRAPGDDPMTPRMNWGSSPTSSSPAVATGSTPATATAAARRTEVGGVRKVAGLTSRATEGPTVTNPCGDGGIYTRVDTQRAFIMQVLEAAGIDHEP